MIIHIGNAEIAESELHFQSIRSSGPGGQHVNKVETGIRMSLDIRQCSLPEDWKMKLLELKDRRISKKGILTIKATSHKSQELNKKEAIQRMIRFLLEVSHEDEVRKPTKPPVSSMIDRKKEKEHRSILKRERKSPDFNAD